MQKILFILMMLIASVQADVFTEVKAAYFRPTAREFRSLYSDSGLYGIELTGQVWRGLYAWGSTDCFYQTGKSTLGNSTKVTMVPIGLGLKYLIPVKEADVYFGAGILGTYLHTHDRSPYVIQHNSHWGVGAILKAGVFLLAKEHLFFDLFTNYSFTKVNFHDTDGGKVIPLQADISGWSIGAGIGYRFGAS